MVVSCQSFPAKGGRGRVRGGGPSPPQPPDEGNDMRIWQVIRSVSNFAKAVFENYLDDAHFDPEAVLSEIRNRPPSNTKR